MGKYLVSSNFLVRHLQKLVVAEPRARGTAHLRFENRVSPKPNIKTVLGDRFPKSAAFRSSKKTAGSYGKAVNAVAYGSGMLH
jgi:hypothetical protein